MTTAVQTRPYDSEQSSELLERVVIGGDLSTLQPSERLQYYREVCASLGLNPLTKPFAYLRLNGKLILYALKDATEQLRKIHSISVERLEREVTEGVYVVTAYVKAPSGRVDSDMGAVAIDGLKGEARANAMLKAVTKAKRRSTLSICGLGMLDESEVESIPGATPVLDLTTATELPIPDPGHSMVAPARTEMQVEPAPSAAPAEDWVEAFQQAGSIKALSHLWRSVTTPDTWGTFTKAEQELLTVAKDAGKERLRGAA